MLTPLMNYQFRPTLTLAILLMALAFPNLTRAEDGKAHAERAMILHKEKKFSDAMDAVNAALQAGYKNHDIYILGGDCLMRLHDYKSAHFAFDEALKFNQTSNIALRGRLSAAMKIGNAASALDASGRLIDLGEDEYLRRGKAYSLDRRHFLAISNYQHVLRRSKPGSGARLEAVFERGEALLALNIFDLALADFDRAAAMKKLPAIEQLRGEALAGLDRSVDAIAAFTKSLELHEHEDVLLLRGREQLVLRQWDKAIADFQRAAEVAPDDEETQRNAKGNIARTKQRAADPEEKKNIVPQPDPNVKTMKLLRFDENPAAAKKMIDAVLAEDPKSVPALHALHRYYQSTGDHQTAFKTIAAASKIDRDNVEILKDFGTAAENINRRDYALQAISRAIALGEKSLRPRRAERFIDLGIAGAALSDIDAALESTPKDPRLHFLRSISLLEQPADIATASDADAAFKKAIESGYKGQRTSRAQVLDDVGRPADAIIDYTYDIETGHAYAGVHLRRAWSYQKLGKLDLAKKDLEAAAKKAKPGSHTAKTVQMSIEQLKMKLRDKPE